MPFKTPNFEDELKRADALMAQGKRSEAHRVLLNLRRCHFFSEELHDRLAACESAAAHENVSRNQKRTNVSHWWSPFHYFGSRANAGLHWILSGRDDNERRKWRTMVLEEFASNPELLFSALQFPELPFDRFDHPAVNERLATLRAQLLAKGYDDAKLRALLHVYKNRKWDDRIALAGCATVSIVVIFVICLAVIGFNHLRT